MDEVIIVHFLCIKYVTVVFLTEVFRVDSIRSQEFLVGHAKRLTNGLCNELSLCRRSGGEGEYPAEGKRGYLKVTQMQRECSA